MQKIKFPLGKIYIITLLFISLISHWYVFFDFKLLNSGDWIWIPSEVLKSMWIYNIWIPHTDFGSIYIFASNNIFYWFASVCNILFGMSWDIFTRTFFLIPIIFLTPVFSFFLFKKLLKNDTEAFFAASLYSFNTLFLKLQLDFITYGFIWWILPAFFLSTLLFLEQRKKKYLAYNALLIFLGIGFEIRIMLLVISYVGLFSLFYIFAFQKNTVEKLKSFTSLIISIVLGAMMHLFWLLPIKLSDLSSGVLSNVSPTPFKSFYNLTDALTLHYYGWSNNITLAAFIPEQASLRFILIPIISILGIIAYKRHKERIFIFFCFFGITLIIFTFLGKQEFQPLPYVYGWLFENIPLFNLYRESSKFFILIALSTSFFFGIGLNYIFKHFYKSNHKRMGVLIISCLLFFTTFFNLQHFFDQKIEGMTKGNLISQDEIILNNYLSENSNFSRVFYVPLKPRFAFFSMNHPAIFGTNLTNLLSRWTGSTLFDRTRKPYEQILFTLQQNYSESLFNSSSVEYIVIPANEPRALITLTETSTVYEPFYNYGIEREWYIREIDKILWLKKIDIGTEEIVIYQNLSYKQPIHSFVNLYSFATTQNLNNKYHFVSKELANDFNFISQDAVEINNKQDVVVSISIPFESVKSSSISINKITSVSSSTYKLTLYSDENAKDIFVVLENNKIIFYKDDEDNLSLHEEELTIKPSNKIILTSVPVTIGLDYDISINNAVYDISTQPTLLGKLDETDIIKIYKVEDNIVTNGSFEDGLWQEEVGDCNNHDSNGVLGMQLIEEQAGTKLLQLEATRHIACTNKKLEIASGEYIFSMRYKGTGGAQASYYIGLNGENNQPFMNKMPIVDSNWHNYKKKIDIPATASIADIFLYSYPSDGFTNNTTRYDDIEIKKLTLVTDVILNNEADFIKKTINSLYEDYSWSYTNPNYSLNNIILNSSLESGLWNQTVGDCNNYDSNSLLKMSINDKESSEGEQSLQLEATRHIACTGTSMQVRGGGFYLLSFDYQGTNDASYHIAYDNASSTNQTGTLITQKNQGWKNFSKIIKIPRDANSMSLTVYARSTNGIDNNITLYDNFKLIEIPDIANRYYIVSDPELNLKNPRSVNFGVTSPSKKFVQIKGATTPFFLAFNDAYHPQWKLLLHNSTKRNFFNRFMPWSTPDKVQDEYHYSLNTFLNAWYVDTYNICLVQKLEGCTLNADGSYDIEMIIEFWPQRWFYVGLIISGITLVGVLGYLVYAGVQSIRRRRKVFSPPLSDSFNKVTLK